MAKEIKKPIVTRKHLARLERERLQTRYIVIVSTIVIALVVVLIGWGIIQTFVMQPRQPVASVDGQSITTHQFQAYARFERGQIISQYQQYQYMMQLFGGSDANSQSYFQQYLSQLTYQLEPTLLGQNTIDRLVEDRLIRREAAKQGVTVSSAEVDKAIQDYLGYYPDGTPTPQPTTEVIPTSTLSPLQATLSAPLPTSTPTQTITSTQTAPTALSTVVTPTATATAAITATPAPTQILSPTQTSAPTATPTQYILSAFRGNLKQYLTGLGVSESDLRWIFESELLREKMLDIIAKDVSQVQDEVWVHHIVVADETTAKEVKSKLDAGEDFALMAEQYSTDTATNMNGGDLGWFYTGTQDTALETAAFSMQVGQISDPIQTATAWEIIQLVGHEPRQVSDSEFQQLRQQAFTDWLTTLRDQSNVVVLDTWKDRVPTEPSIPATAQPSQQ